MFFCLVAFPTGYRYTGGDNRETVFTLRVSGTPHVMNIIAQNTLIVPVLGLNVDLNLI